MNDHAPFVNLRVGVGKFYYGSGCIRVLSEEVTRLGGKPFVIGGPTTTPLVMNLVHDSFSAAGITPVVRIHTGACSRSFYVGDVKAEDVKAKYESGVLTVLVPKKEPKKIVSGTSVIVE